MRHFIRIISALSLLAALVCFTAAPVLADNATPADVTRAYQEGDAPPIDSELNVSVGDMAPDFTLPSIQGEDVTLSDYRGKKNVVISFVPAAFTPVCSDQWPGYCLAEPLFRKHDAILLGISTDNLPSLYVWTSAMDNLWFPVLSDFWPHGEVARKFGVLRSTGVAERALFVVDKQGVIRYIDVHDINSRPDLGELMSALEKVNEQQ
ncbi:peroxiredoxin [Oceanidesulfovibrio indonesiensis]|uniref:Peroxiredoxin n=1 Tax=Oceanidesulfovibrio indonesiensis TaxID=54767 RepID=A0A7M3MBR4_9BACT|nr:peroxiredoxin [Oceanidesulfovibrio indonesiensis]TVM15182.1 peroxiredoxin [Oceanidesulfovibrio indonesiensis]